MDHELKRIKKLYGEKFSHLCRDLFSTILEINGLLLEILTDNFESNHFLYDDIMENNLIEKFKNYIYDIYHEKISLLSNNSNKKSSETPEELMEKIGYILKECKTEEEIQEYKKYYAKGEELCTFKDRRLNNCRVFFAVKKNVNEIKRENFKNPKRQDEYGTSVISIQFTKDGTNTLSIKNRYNHTVSNPDATFSNDLDNIISGLTESFENTYKIIQKYKSYNFEIPSYVKANDGKFYKYNYELNNIYYCPNNIIIDHHEVKRFAKERYIIIDYFVLDLIDKEIFLYDKQKIDSFIENINNIHMINILNEDATRRIIIIPKIGEDIELVIDNQNRLIEYKNNNIEEIKYNFLFCNQYLRRFEALLVKKIQSCFLWLNVELETINCPNLQEVENNFLYKNYNLKTLELPNLKKVGKDFLHYNKNLKVLELPNLQEVEERFLMCNKSLKKFIAPNLQKINRGFLYDNEVLEILECPKLDDDFYLHGHVLELFVKNKQKVLKK